MRLLRYLKRRAALLDELETLRRQNAALTEALETERIRSWMRLSPKAAHLRSAPHPVYPGRHAAITEVFTRRKP